MQGAAFKAFEAEHCRLGSRMDRIADQPKVVDASPFMNS